MLQIRVLQLPTCAIVAVVAACSHPAPSHEQDAGDDAAPDAAIAMFQTGTWMLSSIARTPDPRATCYSTLFHLDVAPDHVQLGERRIECGDTTESVSELDFTLASGALALAGQQVGTLTEQVLDVTLPGGAGSLHIDLGGAAATYRESETALGTTTTFTGTVMKMPDDRPIALADAVSGTEDVALTGRLRAARLPAAVVSFAVSTPPARGTVTSLDATTGDFGYRGNANANGSDAIASPRATA